LLRVLSRRFLRQSFALGFLGAARGFRLLALTRFQCKPLGLGSRSFTALFLLGGGVLRSLLVAGAPRAITTACAKHW
jgi:hypothetical protein